MFIFVPDKERKIFRPTGAHKNMKKRSEKTIFLKKTKNDKKADEKTYGVVVDNVMTHSLDNLIYL